MPFPDFRRRVVPPASVEPDRDPRFVIQSCSTVASSHLGLILVVSVLAVSVLERRAEAQDVNVYEQKATTAFALGHFADAAESFEKAFELKPDPALLYNAAQAHRLAGNKERALTLYENYLRVYGTKERRTDVAAHIDELRQAIARDKAVATSPPTATAPVVAGSPAPAPAPAPESQPSTSTAPHALPTAPVPPTMAPVLVAAAPPPPDKNDSLAKRPWFWVAVGGGVVVAAILVTLLATGGAKDPSPSIGMASGN